MSPTRLPHCHDNLNTFYARFDSKDNYSTLIDELEAVCDNDNPIDISEHEVRLLFKELHSRKSTGPDNISPLLLKSCHNELSGVYQHNVSTKYQFRREKRRQMKRNGTDIHHIEYTEICKAIRSRMSEDINNYNEEQLIKSLEDNKGIKTIKRKQCLGRSNIISLKGREEGGRRGGRVGCEGGEGGGGRGGREGGRRGREVGREGREGGREGGEGGGGR